MCQKREMFSQPALLSKVELRRNLRCQVYSITSVHMLLSWAIKCPVALSVNATDTLTSVFSWTGCRMKLCLAQVWLDHTARTSTALLCQFAIPSSKVTWWVMPWKSSPWNQAQQTICSATWITVCSVIHWDLSLNWDTLTALSLQLLTSSEVSVIVLKLLEGRFSQKIGQKTCAVQLMLTGESVCQRHSLQTSVHGSVLACFPLGLMCVYVYISMYINWLLLHVMRKKAILFSSKVVCRSLIAA